MKECFQSACGYNNKQFPVTWKNPVTENNFQSAWLNNSSLVVVCDNTPFQ